MKKMKKMKKMPAMKKKAHHKAEKSAHIIKSLLGKHKPKKVKKHKKMSKGKGKVEKVMHEFKEGKLHSGSKKGPMVSNPKQAIAIGLSEARREGAHIPKKKKKSY